jgi:hypothetical protein
MNVFFFNMVKINSQLLSSSLTSDILKLMPGSLASILLRLGFTGWLQTYWLTGACLGFSYNCPKTFIFISTGADIYS